VIYEQTIKDPKQHLGAPGTNTNADRSQVEIETQDMQGFLGQQVEVLEQLKADDEKDRAANKVPEQLDMSPDLEESGRVNEHIGPVQFNMGGIQVDADDMLRKLKVSFSQSSPPSPSIIVANGLSRNARPIAHQRKRLLHPLLPMKRHTTKPSQTFSLD
jgi:dynein light intermediate chain 1